MKEKLIKHIEQLLELFGYIPRKRAIVLSMQLHAHYVDCVVNGVEEDFNVSPSNLYRERAIAWWRLNFERMLDEKANEVEIANEPRFNPSNKPQPLSHSVELR